MGKCEFYTTCFYLNDITITMPLATRYAIDKYCDGHFFKCTINKIAKVHGIGNVPKYASPDCNYELIRRSIEFRRQLSS